MSGRRRRGASSRGKANRRRAAQPATALEPGPDQIAAELAREIAVEAQRAVREVGSGLEAQLFAASLAASWDLDASSGLDPEQAIGLRVVAALERTGDTGALASLRALASVGSETIGPASAAAADRVAAGGTAEPAWRSELGGANGSRAWIAREPTFDEVGVLALEFERAGSAPYAVAVLVDNDLGGLAKSIVFTLARDELIATFAAGDGGGVATGIKEIDLGEGASRCREALWLTEHTLGAPVDEDFGAMARVLAAHLRSLPGPDRFEQPEISADAREEALASFLASPEAQLGADPDDVADVATLAIDFGSDYVSGAERPLRWSPTVVELFMCDYLPRKVLREREFFALTVPPALSAWVRYAGRVRGIPPEALELAAAAVGECKAEMLAILEGEPSLDPSEAVFAALAAAREAGVDHTGAASRARRS